MNMFRDFEKQNLALFSCALLKRLLRDTQQLSISYANHFDLSASSIQVQFNADGLVEMAPCEVEFNINGSYYKIPLEIQSTSNERVYAFKVTQETYDSQLKYPINEQICSWLNGPLGLASHESSLLWATNDDGIIMQQPLTNTVAVGIEKVRKDMRKIWQDMTGLDGLKGQTLHQPLKLFAGEIEAQFNSETKKMKFRLDSIRLEEVYQLVLHKSNPAKHPSPSELKDPKQFTLYLPPSITTSQLDTLEETTNLKNSNDIDLEVTLYQPSLGFI